MTDVYKIGVKLAMTSNAGQVLGVLGSQILGFRAKVKDLEVGLNRVKLAVSGALGVAAGAGILGGLGIAVSKAAELQKQMIGIQVASRGSAEQMRSMRQAIEQASSATIFSSVDVAKIAKVVATSTGLSAPQVQSLIPVYARYADVQELMKGTGYQESVPEAVRLAHGAQHYDAVSLSKYLDLLTKASFLVPGSITEVGHALKYSQGIAKTALGVSDEENVLLAVLLNRLGFAGSRGGTNLIAAMTRTIPGVFGSGLMSGKSAEALKAMGMVDPQGHSIFLKSGKFDSFAWMGGLSQYVAREMASHPEGVARQDIMTNFQHAFGAQGDRVAALLSDPKALQQLKMIGDAFAKGGGVSQIQSTFANDSVSQKYMVAKTNFDNLMIELGYQLLPAINRGLTIVNKALSGMIVWMTNHQGTVKAIAVGLAGLGVALVAAGAVAVAVAAGPIALWTAGVGAVGAIVLGVTTYFGGLSAALNTVKTYVGALATGLGFLLNPLGTILKLLHIDSPAANPLPYAPPTPGQWKQAAAHVYMDGKKVGEIVTAHQTKAANRPNFGTGRVDYSMTRQAVGSR